LTACELLPPLVSNTDVSFDPTQATVYQWRILAADVSVQSINRIAQRERPLRIALRPSGPETTFSRTLEDLLTNEFVDRGLVVLTEPDDHAVVLNYDLEVVQHAPEHLDRSVPGNLALLGADVVALREPLNASSAADPASRPLLEESNTEVILDASLLWPDDSVTGFTDLYYVPDNDAGHYDSDSAGLIAGASDNFTITFDSYLQALSAVRLEADRICTIEGMTSGLVARDMSQRMQTATFHCYGR